MKADICALRRIKMADFESIQLQTGRILRDYPDLRTIDKREEVWQKVKETIPNAKFSTVERIIRKLQNTLNFYLPLENDKRYEKANAYKAFFKKTLCETCI